MALPASYLLFLPLFLPLTAALPRPDCPTHCGDIQIPYPFGIGEGCYIHPFFNINCDHNVHPPKAYLSNKNRSQVIQIQVPESQVRVKYPYLAKACFPIDNSDEDLVAIETSDIDIDLSFSPYTLSEANFVSILGCDDFVRINGKNSTFIGGCTSICPDDRTKAIKTCPRDGNSGNGCCRSTIPKGTTHLSFNFTDMHDHWRVEASKKRLFPCSYAFVGEKEKQGKNLFSYNVNGLSNSTTFQHDNPEAAATPLVLDWRIGNENCAAQVMANHSASHACIGQSHCEDFGDGVGGYRCSCNKGYEGNPYLSGRLGCSDINECLQEQLHDCKSSSYCQNTPGGYDCFCPRGYHGDGRKNGRGCSPSTLINAFIGVGSGIGFILLLSACFGSYNIFKQRKDMKRKEKFFKRNGGLLLEQEATRGVFGKTNLFTANELEKATDHFNDVRILGQGGHGTVYKGILSDGRIVAIKKAKLVEENQLGQFINEMVVLSQINHKHIVKLLGCCLETAVPLLVYEFVPNGTLFNLIHDLSNEFPVTWNMRLKIATDVAGAIAYLHYASSIPIYHRDIKSSNILLDEKYVVKVSDFGASRLVPVDQTHLTTMVTGTFGYLDPEFFQSGQFTEKSDVYSFGVVLVELLTGEKPISFNRAQDERNLATHFLVSMVEKNIDNILDDQVIQGAKEEVMAVAKLAKRCLNLNGKMRPTMKAVAMELDNIRKSQASISNIGEIEDHQDVREHEAKMMALSSFDYSWTISSTSSLPPPKSITHPLMNDSV